jgi:hypothetical protein
MNNEATLKDEFLSVFLKLSRRSQRQVGCMIMAYDAANRRAWLRAACCWLAFVAINPPAAIRCMRVNHARIAK